MYYSMETVGVTVGATSSVAFQALLRSHERQAELLTLRPPPSNAAGVGKATTIDPSDEYGQSILLILQLAVQTDDSRGAGMSSDLSSGISCFVICFSR